MKPCYLALLLIACCCPAQTIATESATRSYSNPTLLRNWVLSRCLAKAYPSPVAKEDAEATASAYLEFGNAPIEAYEEGERLVGQYLLRHYKGVGKGQFNTMKCIDLFHGKEVTELVRKYAGGTK